MLCRLQKFDKTNSLRACISIGLIINFQLGYQSSNIQFQMAFEIP